MYFMFVEANNYVLYLYMYEISFESSQKEHLIYVEDN